ncbi:glycerophosphodiester phosphodiesterase [Aeromicrobium camelliae]|uniref:Glycerophosphodiester phosphodiesterase n=1 Tax=Aeromicrobium camelliae TaxID=1538144 RepID=A0A3N6YY73_9ACTN|nr:glycerophosphodiester phosphodiesterase family protein [Aeromicrobium camelliae]RQN02721.1 glycerophosphodiester phosphodiesterase [Aeromicrobium camelliae]
MDPGRTTRFFDSPPPLAFAHRGGADTGDNVGVENSLRAFQHAYDLGYRHLETDVRATRDGVPYAVHDARLSRLTGDNQAIATLTSVELDALLLGDREPIVRLDALLTAFPAACFNIDVKAADAIEPTCRVLEDVEAVDRVCLASFSHRRLQRLRSRLPQAAFSASSIEVARMRLGRAVAGPVDCFQIPEHHGRLRVLTPAFLERAHRSGRQVHVWTVDDPAAMHRLLDMGVDGIMTDRTDLLKDVLVSRGQWREESA